MWETLYCKGDFPEPRKNHIAVLIGCQILIHGGINSFSKSLKDSIILDLCKFFFYIFHSIFFFSQISMDKL